MNLQQKISLWLGCVLFSLSNLCPPWLAVSKTLEGHVRREAYLGFHFVWRDFGGIATYVRPDFSRLILEDAVIVGVTLIAVLTMKGQADWRLRAIAKRVSFSRYQQAALVLTVLSVGVMLVSGANWRLSIGTLLLGLTLAWTVGSDNRLLHYLCLMVGVAALVTPVGLSWRQHRLSAQEFSRSVQEFEANLPRLAQRYPLNAGCPVAPAGDLLDQIAGEPQSNNLFDFQPESSGAPSASSAPIHSQMGQFSRADIDPHQKPASGKTSSRPPSHQGNGHRDAFDEITPADVVGEEQTIPLNNSTELYAVLTQMGYAEGEKQNIEARIAKDLDSKKIGRADWILPCPSSPESKVHFQIFDATGSEFLNWPPPWLMDAFVKGVNVTAVPANEKPGTEPRPFRVLAAFWSLPLVSFLGVVIGTTGGANLTRVRRRVQR